MREENSGGEATAGICNEGRRQTNVYQLITNVKYLPIRPKWAVKPECAVRIDWCRLGNTHTWHHLLVELLLRDAVHLLSINQARPVRLQNPKRRVVLEDCEDVGAEILLVVEEPNTGRDSQNGDHAEDDQDGQHRAVLCAQQSNHVRAINPQLCGCSEAGVWKFTYSASLSLPLKGKNNPNSI